MRTIKGEELVGKELEVLEDGALRLVKEKSAKYVPMIDERYYYVDKHGCVHLTENSSIVYDKWLISHNLVFKTKEECEEYKNFLELLDEYRSELDWENENELKFRLHYNHISDKIEIDCNARHQIQGAFYFKCESDIDCFIKKAGENNIKRFMFDVWE